MKNDDKPRHECSLSRFWKRICLLCEKLKTEIKEWWEGHPRAAALIEIATCVLIATAGAMVGWHAMMGVKAIVKGAWVMLHHPWSRISDAVIFLKPTTIEAIKYWISRKLNRLADMIDHGIAELTHTVCHAVDILEEIFDAKNLSELFQAMTQVQWQAA